MTETRTVIGFLGGRESRAAHFASLEPLLPPGVGLETEPLDLWREPSQDAAEAEGRYVSAVVELVRGHEWHAVALTGTPNQVLFPGALERIRSAVGMPVVVPVDACAAALRSLGARRTLLLTPFDQELSERVSELFAAAGIEPVLPESSFGSIDEAGALGPDAVYEHACNAVSAVPGVEAICYQGARLDPLPVLERLEHDLSVPVVASNPAMAWQALGALGQRHRVEHGGRLLREWPAEAAQPQ